MWPQSFAVQYGEKPPCQVFCQQNTPFFTAIMVASLSAIIHGGKQFSFFHKKQHVESTQISQRILALRSYKKRPCEGLYFLPSRVWIFFYSCVFFLVCTWIFHKCTVCISICPFSTVCNTWFFNLNIRATLHTFVLCNLLFRSKSLWIELAWNAYWKAEPKPWWILKNDEETFTVKRALSIECFSPCNFPMHFVLLAKSEWTGTFIWWNQETMDSSDWNLFAKN